MNLRVISCESATADNSEREHTCPFFDWENEQCRHPAVITLDDVGFYEGPGVNDTDHMPEWCPLRCGAITVSTDAVKVAAT